MGPDKGPQDRRRAGKQWCGSRAGRERSPWRARADKGFGKAWSQEQGEQRNKLVRGELLYKNTTESRAELRHNSHGYLRVPGSQTDPQYGQHRKAGVPETEGASDPKMNTGLLSLVTRTRANL